MLQNKTRKCFSITCNNFHQKKSSDATSTASTTHNETMAPLTFYFCFVNLLSSISTIFPTPLFFILLLLTQILKANFCNFKYQKFKFWWLFVQFSLPVIFCLWLIDQKYIRSNFVSTAEFL